MDEVQKGSAATMQQASLSTLVRGAAKTFENAEQLYREAELLSKHGAIARALCLHQISLEECSKINNLGAWAVSLVVGDDVNQKAILGALRRHAAKNKHNAYMLPPSDAEKDARSRGDWKAALQDFRAAQDEFHDKSNQAKNASLYVDWQDDEFVAPSERITKEMLVEIAQRNAEYLGYAQTELRMFQRLEGNHDAMKELLSTFMEGVERIRENAPEDQMAAMEELLMNFLETGKQRLQVEPKDIPSR